MGEFDDIVFLLIRVGIIIYWLTRLFPWLPKLIKRDKSGTKVTKASDDKNSDWLADQIREEKALTIEVNDMFDLWKNNNEDAGTNKDAN